MRPPHTTDERVVLDRLRMTRVAKDLFLSEWYRNAGETLLFSPAGRDELDRIGVETARERENLLDVVEQWARRLAGAEDGRTVDVVRVARRDFLLALIDAKIAAGDALERASLIAPEGLKRSLETLAAEDFRHANELRRLLVTEVQEVLGPQEPGAPEP